MNEVTACTTCSGDALQKFGGVLILGESKVLWVHPLKMWVKNIAHLANQRIN